jgi:hypothetical protein
MKKGDKLIATKDLRDPIGNLLFLKNEIYNVLYIDNEDVNIKICLDHISHNHYYYEFNIEWVIKNFKKI